MTSIPKLYSSLLITESTNPESNRVLIDILNDLGSLQTASTSIEIVIQKKKFDLIIIDAVSVVDPKKMVSLIRTLDSTVQIVVLSASIHWKIAKAVIQAGATDYLPKSLTKEEMLTNFQTILNQHLVDKTNKR